MSALAGVATVPAIYAAAAKLISRRAGLIAAAIACCNPLLIWYSQEARSYALLVLFATLSLVAFAHARLPQPPPHRLVAWALTASATLATHYYGVLAVLPEAVWLLWVHRRDRKVALAVGAVGALGLALVPLGLSQRPQASWIAPWRLDLRLGQIAPQTCSAPGLTSGLCWSWRVPSRCSWP
ncbi:MAG: glycosyltransferase family 39 protein [Solirubrobacteraceae bacterium]